jgi:HK97 family phage major capsid protein
MPTIAEQITAFEQKRAATVAAQDAIMTKASDEVRTLDASEKEQYDTHAEEIKEMDEHIARLKAHEERNKTAAVAVDTKAADTIKAAASHRAGAPSSIITVRPNIEKGVKFARFAMSLIRAKGNLNDALAIFQNEKRWMDQTPEIAQVLKAAVAAGDTTTSGWASELVYNQNLAAEFVEYLRPMTILGKLNLRRIPFNVRMGQQNGTASGYWVGQGAPIPMSKPGFTSQSLGQAKCAGLVAIDEELARSSSPSAELLVRDDLAGTISTFLDVQFVDPNVAAVANVSPASVTNGVSAVTATGTAAANLRTDLATLLKSMADADQDISDCVWIMTPNQALQISLMLNSLGLPLYPEMGVNGGKLLGIPVITSNSANIPGSPNSGCMIILVNQREVFLADDGQVTVDVSREASIQMLDNPTNTSTGSTTATSMVSMFQTHSLALRATRFINWAKRRTTAVAYIKEAAYVA